MKSFAALILFAVASVASACPVAVQSFGVVQQQYASVTSDLPAACQQQQFAVQSYAAPVVASPVFAVQAFATPVFFAQAQVVEVVRVHNQRRRFEPVRNLGRAVRRGK